MLFYKDDLSIKYQDYVNIGGKVQREVEAGHLIPLKRGLYEDDPHTPGKYLANVIYGPSYLSLEFALSCYSLIPEAVYRCYTCATFGKRKSKQYQNHFGLYLYHDVPAIVSPLGVTLFEEKGYSYHLATPEKALCDKLYTSPPMHNLKELGELLFEDLRIDDEDLFNLDQKDLLTLAPLYHTKNLNLLSKMIKRKK